MLTMLTKEIELSDKEFAKISSIVYSHCGINLHEGKKELVRSRLAKRLRLLKIGSFAEYIDFVTSGSNEKEFSNMIDAVCTNLTSFFRERQHFNYLEEKFLNYIRDKKTAQGSKKIRAWSAGCSSGEEPYSMAITLMDYFKNDNWDVKILATDVSGNILQKARQGVYDHQRIAPVENRRRNTYLTSVKKDNQKLYQVKSNVKNIIQFSYLNLMEDFPFKGPLDIIFCRNVMIYFDKPTQQKLVAKFWNVLDRSGILFTGHSESLTGIKHQFKYVQPTIYQKA